MRTILVTGGAGFIGSHLIEELQKDANNRLISLDNYSTGKTENQIAGVQYVRGETLDIDRLIGDAPSLVYHLGEYARVERSFDDMPQVWRANKDGTFAVLEFCRKRSSKIVYAGSSTKFGDGGLGRNGSPYAWTKASNTELIQNYGAWFKVPYAITYFYNVYGPRELSGKYGTVIEIFREQKRRGEPLRVVTPGTQRRIFTHVKDIVRGLAFVGENGEGDGFGLGSRDEYSILEIAKMFGGPIEMLPERAGNRLTSSIDLSKSETLGWKAERCLLDYISTSV